MGLLTPEARLEVLRRVIEEVGKTENLYGLAQSLIYSRLQRAGIPLTEVIRSLVGRESWQIVHEAIQLTQGQVCELLDESKLEEEGLNPETVRRALGCHPKQEQKGEEEEQENEPESEEFHGERSG